MKLLLHICCAPCLIYPLKSLKSKGLEVGGYFYNPNIHPLIEYNNRKQAVEELNKNTNIELIYPKYRPEEFFREVNLKEDNPGRCALCWRLRLKKTAQEAEEKGYKYFSTTLLVSPYQDQELLKEIGDSVAQEVGVEFYYEDFRPGFRKAHDEARAKGIYCQRYCGCLYSEIDRCKKSEKP
ncbi:MAG: epoxyqueuosine reductase QueH [Candidatus Omnitrophica bacterium]|nr:epoxyqueuosine reductase QueH [Candidatus Omnitrophota bacterium]